MAEECIHISDLLFHLKFNKLVLHIDESPANGVIIIECQKCEVMGVLTTEDSQNQNDLKFKSL